MSEHTATVDQIPMRWIEEGDGTPVVFVHGIPTSPELWRDVLPLVTGARCLAWEMVGYGQSIPAGHGRDISVAGQAGRLAAWLDHLGITRAVLVGHDLGGGVVQILAAREPARVSGIVLTNSIGYDSWPIPLFKLVQRVAAAVRLTPDVLLRPVFSAMLRRGHDDRVRAAESITAHWRHYATHGAARSLVRQVAALDTQDTLAVADRLPELRVPARVVWGAADPFQSTAYGERLARDLGAELERIEGARHFTPEDHPDRIAAAVNDLLESLPD